MVDQTFRSTVPYERAKDARDPERGNDVVKMVVPLLIGALLGWGISEMMDRPIMNVSNLDSLSTPSTAPSSGTAPGR